MRISLRFLVFMGLVFLAAAPGRAVTILNACTEISRSGVYRLERNLTGSIGPACLRIHDTSDVELDCQGHQVTTDTGLAAVVIQTVKNFTLKGCSLPQFSGFSVFVGNSTEGTITKNVIRDMAVYNTDATDVSRLRVVDNRFSEFGKGLEKGQVFPAENVIPIAPGFNRIEARALVNVDLSASDTIGPPERVTQSFPSPRVFPNPWRAGRHHHITFDRLPDESTVKIFTVSAHLVRTLSVTNGAAQWDVRNASGESVASGHYLFVVLTPSGQQTSGQLVVIR